MKTPQDKARAYFEKKFPKEKNTDRWNWVIRFAADFHTEMMAEERRRIVDECQKVADEAIKYCHHEFRPRNPEEEKLNIANSHRRKGVAVLATELRAKLEKLKHLTK